MADRYVRLETTFAHPASSNDTLSFNNRLNPIDTRDGEALFRSTGPVDLNTIHLWRRAQSKVHPQAGT